MTPENIDELLCRDGLIRVAQDIHEMRDIFVIEVNCKVLRGLGLRRH